MEVVNIVLELKKSCKKNEINSKLLLHASLFIITLLLGSRVKFVVDK